MEADQPTGTQPAVAARLAGVDLHNLAVAGQCQLDHFPARTIRDAPADLISLKLGVNVVNADSMRERSAACRDLLTSRGRADAAAHPRAARRHRRHAPGAR